MPAVETPAIPTRNDGFTSMLKGVEVFRAGNHGANGIWTTDDLKTLAETYDPKLFAGRITVDHVEDGPKHGVVEKVYAKGKSLFCDLAVLPEFHDVVKRGDYRDRSVEMFRSFEPVGGKLYLKAVTFLGAETPAVKGMADIKFSDPKHGEVVRMGGVEASESVAKFADFSRPEGVETGVLTKSGCTPSLLGHTHPYVMDEDGNGFTAGPESYEERIGWVSKSKGQTGFHQHIITNREVQPADDGSGNIHTHPISYTFADEGQERIAMAEPNIKPAAPITEPTPAASAEIVTMRERLTAVEAENKRLADENAAIQFRAAQDAEVRRFNDAIAAANKGGVRVTPAEAKSLLAIFMALPSDSTVVKFSDGAGAAVEATALRKSLLDVLAARVPVVAFGEVAQGGAPPTAGDSTLHKMAEKIAADKKIAFNEALIEASSAAKSSS